MIRLSPFLAPVRADPRWHEWLEEANTPLIARSQRQPVNNSVK
jgi:hypothetical protein